MQQLPPELSSLDAQYRSLVEYVESGQMRIPDAIAALAGIAVQDSAGGVWTIDVEGDFLRAHYPGAQPAKTDPSQWPAAPIPPAHPFQSPTPPAQAPWGQQPAGQMTSSDLFTPPPMGQQPPWPGPPAQTGMPNMGMGQPPVMPGYDTGFEAPKTLSGNQTGSRKAGKAPKGTKSLNTAAGDFALVGVLDKIRQHKVTVIIALGGVLLLGFAYSSTRSSDPAGEALPPASSDVFTPDTPSSDTAPASQEPAQSPVAQQTPTVSAPTSADLELVSGAFVAGDAGAYVNTPVTTKMEAASAVMAGADTLGYTLTATPARKAKKGNYTQKVTISGSDGPLLSATLTWHQYGDTWKLTNAPIFR